MLLNRDNSQFDYLETVATACRIANMRVIDSLKDVCIMLLPMLAGSLATLVLSVQGLYRLFTGEFMRSSERVLMVDGQPRRIEAAARVSLSGRTG